MQISLSVSFEAASEEEGESVINDMNLPEGALVSMTATNVIASGTVDGEGNIESE